MSTGRPQMPVPEMIGAALGAGPGLYKGVSNGFDGDAIGAMSLGAVGGGIGGDVYQRMRGGIPGDGSPQGRPTGDQSNPFFLYGG